MLKDNMYRVVFHLDDGSGSRAAGALRNIENLLNDLGDQQVQVELIANGEGVMALLKHPNSLAEQVQALRGRGVIFSACGNALRARGMVKDDLLEPVEIVTSGVGQLTRRQAQGWGYIKP